MKVFERKLFERGRKGARIEKGRKRFMQRTAIEELPTIEKSWWWRWDKAQSTMRYSLVLRWLFAQIGRQWNDIWADLCSMIQGRNQRSRLADEVGFRVEQWGQLESGRVFDSAGVKTFRDLYVDEIGILHAVSRPKLQEPQESQQADVKGCRFLTHVPEPNPVFLPIDSCHKAVFLAGHWWLVEFEALKAWRQDFPELSHEPACDVILRCVRRYNNKTWTGQNPKFGAGFLKEFWGEPVHAIAKCLLSEQEIQEMWLVERLAAQQQSRSQS